MFGYLLQLHLDFNGKGNSRFKMRLDRIVEESENRILSNFSIGLFKRF